MASAHCSGVTAKRRPFTISFGGSTDGIYTVAVP